MKNFIKWLKSLFKKPKPVDVTPPVVTPPVVTPPVVTPPKPVNPSDLLYEFDFMGRKLYFRDPKGPINPKWVPSMEALVFGGFFLPNSKDRKIVLWDPSNAPEGYPARSPAEYPLSYAIGGDGKPVGEAMVVFNGNTFKDDAQIETYILAVAARDAALKKWEAAFNAQEYGGPVSAASLSQNDRAWLYVKSFEFREAQVKSAGRIMNGDIWRTVLSGKNVDMARAINDGESEHRSQHNPGTPDNKELERVVEEAIAAAKAGNTPGTAALPNPLAVE